MGDERYEQGRKRLSELAGEHGESVMAALEEVSPDLARYVIEFGYGDIYSRPTLDDHARQLAAISALSAMGGAEPQLEYHIGIALNVGVPPGQIVETIVFLSPFVGFARTLNAVRSVKRVFASRAASSTCARGLTAVRGRRSPPARRSRRGSPRAKSRRRSRTAG